MKNDEDEWAGGNPNRLTESYDDDKENDDEEEEEEEVNVEDKE